MCMCVYTYAIYIHTYIYTCASACMCVSVCYLCISASEWVWFLAVSLQMPEAVCVCVLVSVSLRMCLGRWDCGSVCGWLYLSAGGGGAGVVDTMFPEKSQEQSYLLSYSLNLLCLHTVLSTNSTYRQAHSHTHIFLCLIDLHVSSILFLSPSFFPRTAS